MSLHRLAHRLRTSGHVSPMNPWLVLPNDPHLPISADPFLRTWTIPSLDKYGGQQVLSDFPGRTEANRDLILSLITMRTALVAKVPPQALTTPNGTVFNDCLTRNKLLPQARKLLCRPPGQLRKTGNLAWPSAPKGLLARRTLLRTRHGIRQ